MTPLHIRFTANVHSEGNPFAAALDQLVRTIGQKSQNASEDLKQVLLNLQELSPLQLVFEAGGSLPRVPAGLYSCEIPQGAAAPYAPVSTESTGLPPLMDMAACSCVALPDNNGVLYWHALKTVRVLNKGDTLRLPLPPGLVYALPFGTDQSLSAPLFPRDWTLTGHDTCLIPTQLLECYTNASPLEELLSSTEFCHSLLPEAFYRCYSPWHPDTNSALPLQTYLVEFVLPSSLITGSVSSWSQTVSIADPSKPESVLETAILELYAYYAQIASLGRVCAAYRFPITGTGYKDHEKKTILFFNEFLLEWNTLFRHMVKLIPADSPSLTSPPAAPELLVVNETPSQACARIKLLRAYILTWLQQRNAAPLLC